MKKKLLYLSGGIVLLIVTCTPIENRQDAGTLLSPADISINAYNTTTGGNQIVLVNNTPGVSGGWDYVIGRSTRKQDTILLPFLGKTTIKFLATTPGGIVTVTKDVTITTIDHPLAPIWTYLAGTGTKTWVWATDHPGGSAYGNGGYKGCNAPCWWKTSTADLTGWGVVNDKMIFDLNGAKNYTLITGNTDQQGLPAGTYKGEFDFDMTATIKDDGGNVWAVGKLTLGQPVSRGFQPNLGTPATRPLIYVYNFVKINNNEMNLGVPEPGAGSWGTAWFWMFKKEGYTY